MSDQEEKKDVFRVLSDENVAQIASVIYRAAMEIFDKNAEKYVVDYLKQNVFQIVKASLGFEKGHWSEDGIISMCRTNGFRGMFDEYVTAKARKHAAEVVSKYIDKFQAEFETQVDKKLKQQVTKIYDEAYKQELLHRLNNYATSDSDIVSATRIEKILRDTSFSIDNAVKLTQQAIKNVK